MKMDYIQVKILILKVLNLLIVFMYKSMILNKNHTFKKFYIIILVNIL